MNYQEKIEEAYVLAENIEDKETRKAVLNALEDGETLAYNEDRWEDFDSLDIMNDLIDQVTD